MKYLATISILLFSVLGCSTSPLDSPAVETPADIITEMLDNLANLVVGSSSDPERKEAFNSAYDINMPQIDTMMKTFAQIEGVYGHYAGLRTRMLAIEAVRIEL